MWEAIIGILGSLASTMLNKYQNDASIERMNEYNSPKSQLARYSEAGLSPANVYSQGAGSGTQNLIGNYQTSLGSDIVSSVMGASQLRQQKQLQRHQLDLIDAQANNQNAEAALKLLEADWLPEEKKAEIANVIADTLLKGSQKSNVEAQTVSETYKHFLMDAQTKEALSKVGVNDQTVRTLIAQEEHFWALVDNVSYDTANIKPEMKNLIMKQATYYQNAAAKALAEAGYTEQQTKLLKQTAGAVVWKAYQEAINLEKEGKQIDSQTFLNNCMSELKNSETYHQNFENSKDQEIFYWAGQSQIIGEIFRNWPIASFFIKN